MAKWGEGDPRWIVEERADATNVNNWHWTEKNATPWSKEKIKSLLVGLKLEDENYTCEITELSKCEGEASANNRKAKLIFFYEFDIKGEWKGSRKGSDDIHRGKFEIPNLSEENDESDLEVIVTANSSEKSEAQELKEFMHRKGSKTIKEQLGIYIADLQKEFSQGMILPSKTNQAKNANMKSEKENVAKKQINQAVVSNNKQSGGVRVQCKKISMRVEFMCQAADLYRALTEREMVSAFTRGDAEIEAEKGAKFRLFGGNVCGEFTEMVLNERIDMKWRFQTWPEGYHSDVSITFEQKDCTTDLVLKQTGVPEAEYERTNQGWHQYYWEPIKMTFGFGARLF